MWQLPYQRALGRAPLCALLGRYLGLPGDRVLLAQGAHGRPQLHPTHDRTLAFNWSHSREQALIAVARGVTPGIDLEQARERAKALALAQRFFTVEEANALAGLAEPARSGAFLQLWTAKEAALKAHGDGISFGLHRLRVAIHSGQPTLQWMDGEDPAAWQLHALAAGPSYLAALAWRGGERRIRLGQLTVVTDSGGVHVDLA